MTKKILLNLISVCLIIALVTGCAKKSSEETQKPLPNPPYNDFNPKRQTPKKAVREVVEGAATGTVAGSLMSSPTPVLGGVIGGTVGGIYTYITEGEAESKDHLIYVLESQDHIQVVQERGQITLLVPTDGYYEYDSYELDETAYVGLQHLAKLVYLYSGNETIYIAGFTDAGIGSERERLKASEARARYMADFLWANGIPLNRLMVRGYGERYDIADNYLIHGAAMNRRVEIQWKDPK